MRQNRAWPSFAIVVISLLAAVAMAAAAVGTMVWRRWKSRKHSS